jgi:hypothetical protein
MTVDQLKDLAFAVKKAIDAGTAAADAAPDDAGTANLDHVYLYGLKRVRLATLQSAGIDCSKWRSGEAGEFHLRHPFGGQGNRNYAGVQAMYKSLIADGVKCSVYYQTD